MQDTAVISSSDSSLQLHVPPDQVRVLIDPIEPKAKSRAIVCVNVKVVFESGLGDWLEANVRYQKMGSGIAREIVRTLDDTPENMHPLNRGLTILSNGFKYDSQTRILTILLRDPKRHGVIDGGHTFRAIEEVLNAREKANAEPPNAYVNMEILSGYDEIASDIISARNSVCAVRPSAIYSLDGVFDGLRQHLKKANLEGRIAFKQNEDKPMSVEEVIAICRLFHPSFADGTTHPMKAYSSRAACVESYAEEWRLFKEAGDSQKWKAGFGKIIHMAPDFLRLVEQIEIEVDAAYRKAGGLKGLKAENDDATTPKEGKEKGKKLKELSGPRHLPITGEEVRSGWPTGYLYPIAGSLRPLIDYGQDLAQWKVTDPLSVFKSVSTSMVKTLMDFAEQFGRKPNAVGKNQLCWKSLYDTIEVALLRSQAKP